jgi:hypothetical protein
MQQERQESCLKKNIWLDIGEYQRHTAAISSFFLQLPHNIYLFRQKLRYCKKPLEIGKSS